MKGIYGNKPAGGAEKNKAKQSQSPGFGWKICKQHWRRHRNKIDDFDLFDAFGDRKPAGFLTPAFSNLSLIFASAKIAESVQAT